MSTDSNIDPTGESGNPDPAFEPESDEPTPQNPKLTNSQILQIGALACSSILTGYPSPQSFDKSDLATAAHWLWLWAIAVYVAKSKRHLFNLMYHYLRW